MADSTSQNLVTCAGINLWWLWFSASMDMYSTARVRITTCTCGMDMSAKIAWWLSMFLGIIYYYIYNKYIYCQNKLVVLILVVDDHWSTIIEESETLLVIETNILPNEYCTMYILFYSSCKGFLTWFCWICSKKPFMRTHASGSSKLQVLLEEWVATNGDWKKSKLYQNMKVKSSERRHGARVWLTKHQLTMKYGSEQIANEIIKAKRDDPQIFEEQSKPHPDAPQSEARNYHVSSLYHAFGNKLDLKITNANTYTGDMQIHGWISYTMVLVCSTYCT